jgi:hypothetical protein
MVRLIYLRKMILRILLLAALVAGPAWSQEDSRSRAAKPPDEIGVTVQLSPGGDLVGPWQAFSVELVSRTRRELDLTIRIEDESFLGTATRREHLSPNAKKRVYLYSAGGGYPRGIPPRYRITDSAGAELAAGLVAISSRGYAQNVFQIGIFSRSGATEVEFGLPNSLNGQEVRFARLGPDTFPDRWAGLMSIDVLLIHDAPFDELTTDQTRALSDYLRQGGTAVFSPGPSKGSLTHPVLLSIAPVRAAEPALVTSLPGVNAAHGNFRKPDPFLVHPLLSGQPVSESIGREIAQFPVGFGRAIVMSFDVLRAPFDTWQGRRGLWNQLLGASPRWFQEDRSGFPGATTARQRSELFRQMSRLINPYPSFGLILGLAIFFLLLVGPANYLLMWKLRRTLLLVLTVPAISIGFLALTVTLGYVLKGTTTVVHSARLLSTRSGLDCARETHLYSLFSPSTRTYDVSCEPGTIANPPGRSFQGDEYGYRRTGGMTPLTVETGSALTIRGLGAGQWQSWDLEGRAIRDFGQGVKFEAGDGGAVRITNGSTRPIERGIYVQTGGPEVVVLPFGPVPPGKTADTRAAGPLVPPLQALAIPADSLGDRLLRPWLDSIVRRPRHDSSFNTKPQRFLVCVLPDDGEPIKIDARVSDRSRSITLLHVAEGTP